VVDLYIGHSYSAAPKPEWWRLSMPIRWWFIMDSNWSSVECEHYFSFQYLFKCNCLHWCRYIKPWLKDWAWHVEQSHCTQCMLSCPALPAAKSTFHLMAKNDITAGSELCNHFRTSLICYMCGKHTCLENSGTTIWTVTGFAVLSANFPYFRSVEWQRCQAVIPASTEQFAPLYMHIAQYTNLPTLCQGDGTFLGVHECQFEVAECKLEVTEWQYSWI